MKKNHRLPPRPSRRRFLSGAAGLGAIGAMEWLGFFRRYGVPGSPKDWGIAKARAQEEIPVEKSYLVYWFQEGGWMSYSMFSPVDTPNHAPLDIPAGTLNPTPAWSDQTYRVTGRGEDTGNCVFQTGGISHGYLATPGADLMADMAVLSSHRGNTFHSGSRFDYHYGKYNRSLSAYRADDERTVMQAFAEEKGAQMLLPNISWHRWLSDGELDLAQYPEGTGYYEKLGPPHAHTVYGRTPDDLKARLAAVGDLATNQRRYLIRQYTDNLHSNFVNGRDGQSVAAFASAVDIHRALSEGELNVDLNTLFADNTLRDEFGIQTGDEAPTYTSVNGNPARSKDTPHTRVQAMMAYELMRADISCGFWIENRAVRGFDSHRARSNVMNNNTHPDQYNNMVENLWDPLRAFVGRLKTTEVPGVPGTSLWDRTTIVICSEMGRTIQGDVGAILNGDGTTNDKYQEIIAQDVCQHWDVSSVVFMGGNVQGDRQYGRVGTSTLDSIPIMPDGSLSPSYDPNTGLNNTTSQAEEFVPDSGHVYSTALRLAGVDPAGKGRNNRPAMTFLEKP